MIHCKTIRLIEYLLKAYGSVSLFPSLYGENSMPFMMTVLTAVSPVLGALIFNMTLTRGLIEKGLQNCKFLYFPWFR